MHRNRRTFAAACALAFALVATVATSVYSEWVPACAIYTEDDAMYWLLGCWYNPPPKDPSA